MMSIVHIMCLGHDIFQCARLHSKSEQGVQWSLFSSPEQRSRRAIVLPPALALASATTNVKVFVKVFKTSLFPNLITDLIHLCYDDTYWSKILCSTIPTTLGQDQGQGHRLRIFMLKFYVKVDLITTKLNNRFSSYLVL